MSSPIRALRFVHHAIRVACREVEDGARALRPGDDGTVLRDAAHALTKATRGHAKGEDVGYFAPLSERFPDAVRAFSWDHEHELPRLDALDAAADRVAGRADAGSIAALLRAAVAVHEHLEAHMSKAEQLLWPLTEASYSAPEQGAMMQAIVAAVPREDMPLLVPWIMDRQSLDEAVAYTRTLAMVMPAPAFEAAKGWLSSGMSPERHAALASALPDLLG